MSTIGDKRDFLRTVERERARADRMGHDFSIITFSLHGFASGNGAMDEIIHLMRRRIRVYDDIGFFGGSRIDVLMPYAGQEQARGVAETISAAVQDRGVSNHYFIMTYPHDWVSPTDESDDSTPMNRWADANGRLMEALDLPVAPLPAWKRLMDLLGAAIGLALLSPVMLAVAGFIKAVSPGPALFKQERVGFLGRTFSCYKFRTMHLGVPAEMHSRHLGNLISSDAPLRKLDATDPRIIPCGKLIRATGLDELPQLFNVLRGDMSLIGPRPCIPYEAGEFKLWQRRRFDVVPGITGLWQVSGKNRTTFTEMIRYDIGYACKRNFLLDAAILFKTIPAIIEQVAGQKKNDQGGVSHGKNA